MRYSNKKINFHKSFNKNTRVLYINLGIFDRLK